MMNTNNSKERPTIKVHVTPTKKITIVGNPNVGKSVLFNCLTGSYVTISNYPGTTVEVSRGKIQMGKSNYEVIDTPGMYSMSPITEEEVGRNILLYEKPELIIHVIDAKNIDRMLPFTFQLIETSIPVILVLNIMDEAKKEGIEIDIPALQNELGIPVIGTISTKGIGIDALKEKAKSLLVDKDFHEGKKIEFPPKIEEGLNAIVSLIGNNRHISERFIGLQLLKDDKKVHDLIKNEEPWKLSTISNITQTTKNQYKNPIEYEIAIRYKDKTDYIIKKVLKTSKNKKSFKDYLSKLMMNPLTGYPILFLILYWGLYKFVGGIGAGTVVDFLESAVFEGHINPYVTNLTENIVHWQPLQDLIVGEYGLITLGLRYATAIILPIVAFFFLVFAIIEDTGYLPRLALLLDRSFKKMGLSGRAVIPMILGLGCATMATMVTRTLATRRERIIATFLLALAVPCSAQFGVIIALMESKPFAMGLWVGIVALILLLVGFLSSKILPGEKPSFYMEVPTLRLPKLSNVLTKTFVRVKWYFYEILPMFLLASLFIWLGNIIGLFEKLIRILSGPVKLMGLPEEAAKIFIFGFFRRDYGAAGLYDLNKDGLLTGNQLVIACVALTLFLPCIAQFLIIIKERGWKIGINISVFILFFTFIAAYVFNMILNKFGVVI